MSEPNSGHAGPATTHVVVATGGYGTVLWTVCRPLWDILPTAKREHVLDAAARVIDPFFVKLVDNLFARLSSSSELSTPVWSLQTIEHACSYGSVMWQVSEGVWFSMPADRRENLVLLMRAAIHRFFHQKVQVPLTAYATKDLP